MEAIMDFCLPPLESRPAVRRPAWMEEKVFSLPSSNFSVPWSLFYNFELTKICRTDFVSFAELKFMYFIVTFSASYNMSSFL